MKRKTDQYQVNKSPRNQQPATTAASPADITLHPRYQTAIHEAGHAVTAAYVGIRFKDVSIRPYGETGGRVAYHWSKKSELIAQLKGTYTGRQYSSDTLE